jgi:hypothetical protein
MSRALVPKSPSAPNIPDAQARVQESCLFLCTGVARFLPAAKSLRFQSTIEALKKEENMIRRMAGLFVIAFILIPVAAHAQNASKEKAAVASAKKWLGLVDKGEYAKSWKQAASYFRKGMPEQKWAQIARTFRAPLGKMMARKLADAAYRTSMPGGPEGQYVLIHFHTSFEKKKAAFETVITVLDKDGKWKVASYLFL